MVLRQPTAFKVLYKTKGFMRVYFQFGAARASGMALLRLTLNKA